MLKGVPQTMDITSIKAVLHNLSNEILPSKFETAQQPEPNTIQIGFRGINNINWIEVCWQGDCARIIKIDRPDKQGNASTLARQLSCGLKYMALVSIKQDKFERVIQLEFAKKPGDEISKSLIFELMGKHSNIFYLDSNQKIIALGKQIKSSQSSFRKISTGNYYSPPPPNNFKKEPNENETFEKWKENLSSFPEPLKNSLLNTYQGVSPILIKQIEHLSNLKKYDLMNKNILSIDNKYLKEIFVIWKKWINCFVNNQFSYTSFDNYFYSVWFPEINPNTTVNLSEELSYYYDHFLKLKKIDELVKKIDSLIYKQINIEKKNFNIQNKLLKNSENHEEYKRKADNIFLNFQINKEDVIEAQNLYKKSKKLKRSKKLICDRLSIYSEKLIRLDEFSVMLENLNSINIGTLKIKIDLLNELKEELCSEFNINTNKINKTKLKSNNKDSYPIEINSPEGIVIQIGRNMRQNDLISFKFSKKQDLWFHAQETPGSHVILKTSTKTPTESDIQISADIAAFFCKAKGNIKVPITLVKIKDLQKIKNGGLGCVSFKNSEVIWGNPTRGKEYIKKNTQK